MTTHIIPYPVKPAPSQCQSCPVRGITDHNERTWSAWALDRLITGDIKGAKEMLMKGLKRNT